MADRSSKACPRISVVTACFNNADTIGDTLASLQAQRDCNFEHVVIDGGSTDGTLELLRTTEGGIDHLVSEPDGGLYDALNKGLKAATGAVVGFLHSDDWLAHEHVLLRIADAFQDPTVEAVYGDLVYVRRSDSARVVRNWRAGAFTPARLRRGWMPPHPTLYVRRQRYEQLGCFDLAYRIAADYESILRLLGDLKPAQVVYIPEVLVHMRLGGNSNASLKQILRKSLEDYRAMQSHGVGGIGTLVRKNLSKVGQFVS